MTQFALPVRQPLNPAESAASSRREKTPVRYVRRIDQIPQIPASEAEKLKDVAKEYVFRANDYYLDLIDWQDENDPIRNLIIPRVEELSDWGKLDASDEGANTLVPGMQHKYSDTALMLVTEVCGAYCRYCFRKRLFMEGNDEAKFNPQPALEYIAEHPEITNVLLTGGDPLVMGTKRLQQVLESLAKIPHVRIIRIGSKMPAFNPHRILDDTELQDLLRAHCSAGQRVYIMCHFDHPRELTEPAVEGLHCLNQLGVSTINQCPIIRGVNDCSDTIAELWSKLAFAGCPPYYLFQGRPTAGNEPYELPLVAGYTIYRDALKKASSGLARRARFSMSHALGKVEMVGLDEQHIYLRFHRAKYPALEGHFFVCRRDDDAYWLDHLKLADGTDAIEGLAALSR